MQPPQLQCTPLSARVPAELSGPAPSSVKADLPAAVVEPSPQSRLHTWPCSTTTLQGLQQQPNLDSRAGFEDIDAQGQLEQLPISLQSANAIIWISIETKGIEDNQAVSLYFLNSSSKQKTASHTLLHLHQSVPVSASYVGEPGDPPGQTSVECCCLQAAPQSGRETSTQLNFSDLLHCGIKH